MRAGCSKIDITPPIGAPIGGNIREDNISRGIHDPLYANVLYLENDNHSILFIGLDIINVHNSFTKDIKEYLEVLFQIPVKNIIIFATHTHSGPDTQIFSEEKHSIIREYLENLKLKIAKATEQCMENTFTCHIGIGTQYEDSVSFNRRIFMKDGALRMNWESLNPNDVVGTSGPIDPSLYVISVKDQVGRIRSVLVNFTLHPAILVGKEWKISRDFVGPLTDGLEEKISKELVVLFANGAEGNINHINVHDSNQTRGFEEIKRIGEVLCAKVVFTLDKIQYLEGVEINSQTKSIKLPRRKISKERVQEAIALLEKVNWKVPSLLDGKPKETYALDEIYLSKLPESVLKTEIQTIQIGDICIVGLPGEFFVEIGLKIKEISPFSHTLIFGLANDHVGYVPTKQAFKEGGYETITSRTSQLLPETEDQVIEHVQDMLNRLNAKIVD
ncbi:neutral/alkaline non-lysosomal ceramidase N-terminal domain-containing protein [Fredinandcohnia sp. QZ13]|uniref:neutral/alkaline non-lysosomal ceramidase N-terminal domain-containing protein n=1 Tax=Fredinandcohnia sp. QZ13 TaxID=3073144 RepID=UPI0028533A0F|nr:neutral/alkaline non-lysosomal ceramidase N-terminal domain-containing protein [Fredinandcohnia sp. QZ13]MDR4887493.1 neutral/alkaline non-lysosomal ceramidase N-terminal domain-containing protein [Fredinandcohnia sp. QZ13]